MAVGTTAAQRRVRVKSPSAARRRTLPASEGLRGAALVGLGIDGVGRAVGKDEGSNGAEGVKRASALQRVLQLLVQKTGTRAVRRTGGYGGVACADGASIVGWVWYV